MSTPSTIKLMDLPDEILLQILASTDDKTLLSTGRVNRRLCAVALDPTLNRLRPHHIIKGRLYLNEQVYEHKRNEHSDLLLVVFKANAVDLTWLVSNTTAIRESGLTPMEWHLLQSTAWSAAMNAARDAAGNAALSTALSTALDAARSTAWHAALDAALDGAWSAALDAARGAAWNGAAWSTAWGAAWNGAAWSAAWNAASNYVTEADVLEYLLKLQLTDPVEIGKYAYQIAECLMLRNIDRALCLRIHSIGKENGLEDITLQLPVDTNPWIMQFHELYTVKSITL